MEEVQIWCLNLVINSIYFISLLLSLIITITLSSFTSNLFNVLFNSNLFFYYLLMAIFYFDYIQSIYFLEFMI